MSLRLTRRGALAIGALALAVPMVAVSTSAAFLSSSSSIAGNSVGTSACTTSTWNTMVSGLSNVTSYMSLGGAATTPSSSSPASSQTGVWTPSTVTTGASGALYCSSDTAVTFDDGADKIAAPNTVTFANWGLNSGSDTMALWFKGTSSVAGGLATVSKTGAGGWTDRGLWIDTGGYVVFGGGGVDTTASTTANAGWSIRSTGTYNDGQWHMVAVVMGNTGSNLGATLYVDGVQQATNTTGSYYATANGAVTTKFQIGDVEKPVGITGVPAVSYVGTIDEFLLVNAALTSAQLSAAMPIGVTSASVSPTQTALTSASVGTSQAFSSISTTANSTDVISASIAPQSTITSASITPTVTVTAASVTPTTASVTAATVTTAQKSISSSTVQTTGTASKVTVSGSTGLKITAAVPSGVTYGTTAGWKNGDYVYVSGVACATALNTSGKCQSGYDTALNGAWYPISNTGGSDITVTVGTATATYFAYCTGAGGCATTAGVSKSQLITMTAAHSLVATDSVVIDSASSTTVVPNGTYTVVSAPTTTTLTINPIGTSTFGVPTALTASGTVTKPVTSAVFTATNSYSVNDVVSVTGLSGSGASTVNVTLGTISARTASNFTVTIAAYAGVSISLSSQSGTATRTTTTATITAANAFSATQTVTISGLTGTNADLVNVTNATIASATSTGFTITIAATTGSVAITAASGTATSALSQVSVTASNTYADGDTVVISGTGSDTLNGSFTVANRTATGFTYTLASGYSSTNIAVTTGTAAVARTLVTVSNTDHGYTTGDKVTIAITGGNATLDGTWTITKIDANSFTYSLLTGYTGANLDAVGTASLRTTSVSSASITPNATITAASVSPQATITSATISPNATVTAATATPPSATVTAATVSPTAFNISKVDVLTSGTVTKIKLDTGVTAGSVKITAAVPGTVTYGTSAGWKVGDWVYVSLSGCTIGTSTGQCAAGWDTTMNGWRQITKASNAGDVSVEVGSANITPLSKCSGAGGDCAVTAGTMKSQVINTSTSTTCPASIVVASATSVPNGTYTPQNCTTAAPFTFTVNPGSQGSPAAQAGAAGTATIPTTTATITAANTFTGSPNVTIAGISGANSSLVTGTFPIASYLGTAPNYTGFTITITATASSAALTSQAGTATIPTTTATITAANTFSATQSVTIAGLTGTNNTLVNGTFTIASATSSSFTITITGTTSSVAITSASGAAVAAQTKVSVTAANNYADGDTVVISGTGSDTLNGSFTVANRTATGFTYTISSYSGANIAATTGIAAVARTSVSVTAANNFSIGNQVTLSGTTGLDGGPYTIASATSTGFTYTISSYSGPNLTTSVGNAMVPQTKATITDTAHGYATNDRVTITTTGTGADTLNGTFTITKVDANTFTYTISTYTGANLDLTGTATTFVPVIKITGTGFTFTGSQALLITGTGDARLDNHVCTVNAAPTPTATTIYCGLDSSITAVAASPAITGTLSANGTVVTVVATNSLTTSDTVTIAGAGAPFNGTFAVASATGSQFTYTVASSAYVSASTGTFAKPITLATVTTDAAHGLVATNSVTISGAGSPFDGTFTIVAAPTTTTFTINIATATGTPTTSSTGLLASKAGLYWAAQLGT